MQFQKYQSSGEDWQTSQRKFWAFGEDRFSGNSGKRVREAIAKIESGGMAALSELAIGHASAIGLSGVDSDDLNTGFMKEQIEFASFGQAAARFENDPGFDCRRRREKLLMIAGNELKEARALRLVAENCDER
jgi:hypothetical protein